MAPIAVPAEQTGETNGTTLKATAPTFHPTSTPGPSNYHVSSSQEAIRIEATYAAHNYHPLPIVFARASGCNVWDPEGEQVLQAPNCGLSRLSNR